MMHWRDEYVETKDFIRAFYFGLRLMIQCTPNHPRENKTITFANNYETVTSRLDLHLSLVVTIVDIPL